MTAEAPFSNQDNEAEKKREALIQQAEEFIAKFRVPGKIITPNGVELLQEPLIADIAHMYRLRLELGDQPIERANHLRETASVSGINDLRPVYNHVPTVMAAMVRNEESLAPEQRALTLPVRLEIISQALSVEISVHINRALFWVNPIAKDLLSSVHDAQGVQRHITVDENSEPRLVSQQFRINATRTGSEAIPGTETSQSAKDLAAKGYGPDSEYFLQSVADMHYDLAMMAMFNILRAEADELRIQLIREGIT
jgi:hypothetical protein